MKLLHLSCICTTIVFTRKATAVAKFSPTRIARATTTDDMSEARLRRCFLALSLVALGVGPVLAHAANRARHTVESLDGFVLITIGGLVLPHSVTHAVQVVGVLAIGIALAGLPAIFAVGFVVRAFVDGAALVTPDALRRLRREIGAQSPSRIDVASLDLVTLLLLAMLLICGPRRLLEQSIPHRHPLDSHGPAT
jgi:hypothetical protein